MIEIPTRLKVPTFRFILLKAGTKIPFEKEWQSKNNYAFDDTKLLDHLNKGGNYGIVTGYGNLLIIDADTDIINKIVKEGGIDNTFTVSSRPGRYHYYYIADGFDGTKPLDAGDKDNDKNLGHIKWVGGQVVAPGSIHPESHKPYELVNDIPIAAITSDKIHEVFAKFFEVEVERAEQEYIPRSNELSITNVVSTAGMVKQGDGYIGKHPTHGSETGHNFKIVPNKNWWYCYRHMVGGGSITLVGIVEHIIDCKQAQNVSRDKWADIFHAAEGYGYKPTFKEMGYYKSTTTTQETIPGPKKKLDVTSHYDLMSKPKMDVDWLVDGIIRNGSIGLFGGKTASYKTWIGLELVYSVASGSDWLNTFKIKKPAGVLFIDEENGSMEIQRRLWLLGKQGVPNLYFTDIQNIKLDNKEWIEEIGNHIKLHPDIKLIFVDTYRRVVSYDENDAGLVSEFINSLKQFIKTYNVAILFTHHFRKSGTGSAKNTSEIEEYEEFRGSSDFVNSAESIFMVKNLHGEGSNITLKCLKLRQGAKFKDQVIKISEVEGKLIIEKVAEKDKTESSKDECAKKIMEWITAHFGDKPVKSQHVLDAMKGAGYGLSTIKSSLNILVNAGELGRPKHGWYKLGVGQNVIGDGLVD